MKIDGAYTFDAAPDQVWAGLLEPDVLAGCIPGCRELKAVGDDQYEIALRVGIGAISGNYTGKVTVTDRNEPQSFRMIVQGRGSGGTIKGDSVVSLRGRNGATEVTLDGDARVTGLIARVGQRLLGSASKMMIDQFFECMKVKVKGR